MGTTGHAHLFSSTSAGIRSEAEVTQIRAPFHGALIAAQPSHRLSATQHFRPLTYC